MITKINKIKDFGIFQDFTWDAALTPFKQRNLIYGWNYSGKTTLSKIFNTLNKNNKSVYFPNAKYTIETIDTKTYNQDTIRDCPYLVKVFNADYIRNVFAWDKESNDGFHPIAFYLGDEAGEIQPKIDKLKNRWNPKITKIQEHYQSIVKDFGEYDKTSGKFAKQASVIRQHLDDSIKSSKFDKSHFRDYVEQIKNDIEKYRQTPNKVQEIKHQAIAKKEWDTITTNYSISEKLVAIGERVKNILEDTAPQSIPFPELDSDKDLFDWVQKGLNFHTASNECKFCGNDFKQDRRNALDQYYSLKLKEIQGIIQQLEQEIQEERKKLDIKFPHESEIATHLRESYRVAIVNFNQQKEKYSAVVKIFENDLKTKRENYFNIIKATHFEEVSVKNEIETIAQIIKKEHNDYIDNFDKQKEQSLDKILKHYVAEYLIEEDYLNKENKYNAAKEIIKPCNTKLESNNKKIIEYESLLKSTVKGQEELNTYLKIFLNRDDIKIEIVNDKYVLKRGVEPAKYLSEGEKTAIAFAYFLTELKSLKEEKKLKETLIFIDDPISSLDSNHIFQVRSLIQHFFNNEDEYKQLFISTHNFEFFSVLLDSNLFKNLNRKDMKEEKCPFYLINRITKDSSVIRKLPKALRSHKSEYAHLFYILKDYNDSITKEEFEFKILLPNALRRFLELYSLFKFPQGGSEVDERLKQIFSMDDAAFHNTKLYHWFSHQQQFEKVAQHDSNIFSIDDAIEEVLEHIKNEDKLHWKGLTGEE